MLRLVPFLIMLATLLLPPVPAWSAEPGVIGPQDKLRLRVYEWRTGTGEAHAWDAFDGEFVVGDDGKLQVPLIGALEAAGRTREELGAAIASRLKETTGLLKEPSAVVEIIEYRPFYIVGSVASPGEYPYRPGMTVLNALSIAGGMRRGPDMTQRFERDAISSRGELRVIALEVEELVARRARLTAELEGAEEIIFPPDLVARREQDPVIDQMLREEERVFEIRRESLQQEVEANERLQSLLQEQIASLESQVELKERQIKSLQEELEGVRDLVERGLGTAPRQASLERTTVEYESSQRDLMRSIISAQVDINQAERNIIAIINSRHREVAQEMRETQSRIETLRARYETARAMLQEAEVIAPAQLAEVGRQQMMEPRYTIVRPEGAKMREIDATEFTPVLPGDMVRVSVPHPELPMSLEGALPDRMPALAESAPAR